MREPEAARREISVGPARLAVVFLVCADQPERNGVGIRGARSVENLVQQFVAGIGFGGAQRRRGAIDAMPRCGKVA
ncbi:hypothetical protein QP162_08410 [Sphingomonas aurantiaca]|uniref:hypothetical protein n=1 Tax=Sphingomonas aurantiaca TaxID=185949 RepID=UPI002FE1C892